MNFPSLERRISSVPIPGLVHLDRSSCDTGIVLLGEAHLLEIYTRNHRMPTCYGPKVCTGFCNCWSCAVSLGEHQRSNTARLWLCLSFRGAQLQKNLWSSGHASWVSSDSESSAGATGPSSRVTKSQWSKFLQIWVRVEWFVRYNNLGRWHLMLYQGSKETTAKRSKHDFPSTKLLAYLR